MDKNVGGFDRTARFLIGGLVLIAGVAVVAGIWEISLVAGGIAIVLGAILLVTGTTQKCPINETAGIDTTK